ncbi:MAG TPA: hypothetical protein VKZ18_16710 [Polyangia bacterium]|nr:hypothetical protein [Polyangia bacterium]
MAAVARAAGAAILGAALLASGAGASADGAPARQAAEAGPPDPYVVDGLVTDGMDYPWTAKLRIALYAGPGSRERVGVLAPGDVVTADRLQLRGRPWAGRVIHDNGPFRAGMRLWVLERDLEEGSFEIWYGGERRQDLAAAIPWRPSDESCGPPSASCFLRFAKEPKQESWFRVKTSRGLVGWTARDRDFSVGTIRNVAPRGPR